jgi:hypothetical protein
MSILRIHPNLIDPVNASDGDVLSYSTANGVIELGAVPSDLEGTANDFATYTTLQSEYASNDYSTYTTLLGSINSVQANLTSVIGAAPSALDTLAEIAAALENDANIAVTLITAIDSVQSNVYALPDSAANDFSTLLSAYSNDLATYTTLQSELNANDYATYNTLISSIDTVQANLYAVTLDTVAANGNSTSQTIETGGLIVSGITSLNSNVTINGMIDSIDRIQFNTLIASDTTQGVIAWNADVGTMQIGLTDTVSVKVGEDSLFFVRAGELLNRGDLVYASGVVGGSGKIEASKYIANNSIDERYIIGIAAESIPNGTFGYIISLGTVRGIDASGTSASETWLEGDILYASPISYGGLTRTMPEAPNKNIPIAFVTSNNASNGSIVVRAFELGYDIGQLHDVQNGTESDGDVLTYMTANSRWEPKSVTTDQSNVYNTYVTLNSSIDLVQANTNLLITLSGIDVQITDANLIPSANNVYSLGSPDRVWKDLYLSGNSLVIGNTVISESTGGGITISAEGGTTSLAPETGNVNEAIATAIAKAQEAIELSIIFS